MSKYKTKEDEMSAMIERVLRWIKKHILADDWMTLIH